jgi:hypothetical protein
MVRWDMLDHNKMFYLGRAKALEHNKKIYDMPLLSESMIDFALFDDNKALVDEFYEMKRNEVHKHHSAIDSQIFEECKSIDEYNARIIGSVSEKRNDIPLQETEITERKTSDEEKIAAFLNVVIPPSALLHKTNLFVAFQKSLAKYHSFIIFLRSTPSSNSRAINYLGLWYVFILRLRSL